MKIEFSDLYKFVVSLGMILILLAILGPWLFLRETFDLFVPEVELSELTNTAREAVLLRQEIVLKVTQLWPWLSGISSSIGMILVVVGVRSWYRNQISLDRKTGAEAELVLHELRSATADERKVNQYSEAKELLTCEEIESGVITVAHPTTTTVMDVEKAVVDKLREISSKHEILVDQVLDETYFDLILRSRDGDAKNYIIEIKFAGRSFSYSWLRKVACDVRQYGTIFSQAVNRLPNTTLLVVMSNEAWDEELINKNLSRLSADLKHRGGKHVVAVITLNELESMSSLELAKRMSLEL